MQPTTTNLAAVNSHSGLSLLRAMGGAPWSIIVGHRQRDFPSSKANELENWVVDSINHKQNILFLPPTANGRHWYVTARFPLTARPANCNPSAQFVICADDYTAMWRLAVPVERAVAERVAARLASQLGGKPAVGQPIPFPGSLFRPASGKPSPVVVLKPTKAVAYFVHDDQLVHEPIAEASDGFTLASEVEVRPHPQLWPGVIPVTFVMLAGEPKVGKSLIAADIAARVTRGAAWPDGAPGCAAGGVVFLETEDPKDVSAVRLEAAGADLRRVLVDNVARDFSQEASLSALNRASRKLGGLGLLVISPMRMFFGDTESTRQVGTRAKIEPLLSWCATEGVTLLGIAHKEAGKLGRSAEEIAGPKALVQRARATLIAMRDPTDPMIKKDPKAARRILTSAGTNMGSDKFVLPYDTIDVSTRNTPTVRVEWT